MHGDAPEEERVSREVQSTFGLFITVVVYSAVAERALSQPRARLNS